MICQPLLFIPWSTLCSLTPSSVGLSEPIRRCVAAEWRSITQRNPVRQITDDQKEESFDARAQAITDSPLSRCRPCF